MSAKGSRAVGEADIRNVGRSNTTFDELVQRYGKLENLPPQELARVRFAIQRTLLIQNALAHRIAAAALAAQNPQRETTRRGRRSDDRLTRAVEELLFDIDHWDRARTMGWGGVASDKTAIDAAINRHYPGDCNSSGDLQKRRQALKKAVARARRAAR